MSPKRLSGLPFVLAATFMVAFVVTVDATAAVVTDLYRASIAVTDRSDDEFQRAQRQALNQVIVKLTGSSGASRLAATRGLLGRSAGYVQQFGYERGSDSSGAQSLFLAFDFYPQELSQEMRARGLPVWGKERPETLVWLVYDGPDGRSLLGAGGESNLPAVLRQRAGARGLPVVVPSVDSGDNGAVATATDQAALIETLLARSERFGTELVLIAHMVTTPIGLVDSTWTLSGPDGIESWSQAGDIPALLVEEGAEVMADRIGARFAGVSVGSAPEPVAITVAALTAASDYARTNVYLQSMDVVTEVFVRAVAADTVTYDLNVRGGLAALRQSVSFGDVLEPLDDGGQTYRFRRAAMSAPPPQ